MQTKFLEVRDRGTFVPVMCVEISGQDDPLVWRAGFARECQYVVLVRLVDMAAQYDPFQWPQGPRTIFQAHLWIRDHWSEIKTGDVIDVEFVLGESSFKKTSEVYRG